MNIFLGVLAVFLFCGMIGERDDDKRRDFKHGFIATVAGIVALNLVNPIF